MPAKADRSDVSSQSPVHGLPGVGPKRAARLAELGIETVEDLLRHAPRAYEDRGRQLAISEARQRPGGELVAVRGRIAKRHVRRAGRGRSTLRVVLEDESGRLEVLWFNAAFFAKRLLVGAWLAAAGRLSERGALLQPEFAVLENERDPVPERLLGIRPLYSLTEGISQRFLHDLVAPLVDSVRDLHDSLPADVRRQAGVEALLEAIRWAHRPASLEEADRGRERLLFDEILPVELALKRRLRERRRRPAPRSLKSGGGASRFVEGLPFQLTPSQRAAVEEIVEDLTRPYPMARMLAGEVGSGKTAVALAVAEQARSEGLQCALLAPTDLLARQHHRSAVSLMPRGEKGVALLTGSLPAEAQRETRRRIASGEVDFVVGTHALLSESTRFDSLGFVVIDEQQRFGVEQRQSLLAKAATPHALVMTATPIPRSLALLAFGDMDVTTLEPRAEARGEVTTRLVPREKRGAALDWIRKQLESGSQAFFVRPRIEGDSSGARELHHELVHGVLKSFAVGLVHGRVPAATRERTLERFREGEIPALVATTIVEVGIDVPGANILWIEGAERLGLAQLHQLRGRIARRGQRGYCWVVRSEDAPEGTDARLGALVDVNDGMRLAEIDLALRGPGELIGSRQSGRIGLFAGLGPHAPRRIASLAERAWRAADLLLDRSPKGSGEEASCSKKLAASSRSPS